MNNQDQSAISTNCSVIHHCCMCSVIWNVMYMGKVGHGLTVFSGSLLCQVAQLVMQVMLSKDFTMANILGC